MLLQVDRNGLFCPVGGFYIDPHRAVDRALITHAHADHARSGCRSYLCAQPGEGLLRHRLGAKAAIESIAYGRSRSINGVQVSFHPSGHVLGAGQIRVEYQGEVWVVSGDYKLDDDPTCAAFEPVACHTFISECTFGLPIYRWPDSESVFSEINCWWRNNRSEGIHSFLYGYSLGKAQRLLAGLDPGIGPIFGHSSVFDLNPYFREEGIRLPEITRVSKDHLRTCRDGAMLVLPPAAASSKFVSGVGPIRSAFASGWMLTRKARRQRRHGTGFVVSDHADWPGLNDAIRSSGAERVILTHGETAPLEKWLRGQGLRVDPWSALEVG